MKPSTERVPQDETSIVQDNEPADRREWLQRIRARADEARTLAHKMQFPTARDMMLLPTARDMMLRLAGTFENLAERLERQQPEQARDDTRES